MFRRKNNNDRLTRRASALPPTEVFSYHSHRLAGDNSRRLPGQSSPRSQSIKHWLKLMPTILSVAAIVISFFYATSLSTTPRFQVPGNTTSPLLRDTAYYEKAASSVLKRSIFNRSKLTIDTTKLAHELGTEYPELGDVTVIIPLTGRRPVIDVKTAQPVMRLSGNGGTFIIDEKGRALLQAGEASSGVTVPLVIDQSGLELQKGMQALPISTISFIHNMTVQLQAKHMEIESITLPPISNEIHLRVVGHPYFIKFDTQGDPREQTGTFLAAREDLQNNGITPAEYMDVRVPEKVFYR